MSESVNNIDVRSLTRDDIDSEIKTLSNNHKTNRLFEMIRVRLLDYKNGIDISTLFNITNYLKEVLNSNPSINRKSILRKIRNNMNMVHNILLDKGIDDKCEKELVRYRKNLEDLVNYILSAEPTSYVYVLDAIATRNLGCLERTFEDKSMANLKDKRGVSLLKNVCSKYIKCIGDIENHKEDLSFYNDLLNILLSNDATLSYDEKKTLLRMIKAYISDLNGKDQFYETKIFYLNSLYKNLTEDHRVKGEVLDELSKKYSVNVSFTDDLMESINLSITNDKLPFIDKDIISIDSPDTKMFDDAISCEKMKDGSYLLGVYVTDVLSSFSIDSKVVKEALKRAFPIYIDKNTRFNMFPDSITKDMCSLNEGTLRPVRAYFFKINDGEIIDWKVIKGKIINKKETSFNDINAMIKNGNAPLVVSNLLDAIKVPGKNKADGIISYASALTNDSVGKYLFDNSYPAVYLKKTTDKSEIELYDKLRESRKAFDSKEYKRLMDSLSASPVRDIYGTTPDKIGFHEYYTKTPITSPLRRSPDLLNMHVMDVCYFNRDVKVEDIEKLQKFIEENVSYINSQASNIESFKREYGNQKVYLLK